MSQPPETCIYESSFAPTDKTDAILVVQGKKLHVNKTLLSCHSDYFNTLFNGEFKEKSMSEIEIEDVDFEDFATLLSLIHPKPITPTAINAERILELADRFLLPAATNYMELFLISTELAAFYKLILGDKYGLNLLIKHALSLYTVKYGLDSTD
ncbi:hypothetical protein GCK72_020971 [Caenorhabditis remanei]|uniref:BTB domain-containing protein n=1 Tax=Caenorhabditis remanei TaxID=31234 RepID=A0A6A5GGW5_CAERE|nr:hypothetical protein GCK72_020971 [Caenorhabditis remanei]KAF1754410.1 hypothetical protein GCK72_020971 [Caenorhabditis remanei]